MLDTIQRTLGVLAIGVLIGHFAIPKPVQIKETVRIEQSVQQSKDQKKDKNVTIVETTSPDGTKKKETKIGETTTTTTETNTNTKITDNKETIKGSKTSIGVIAIGELNKNILTKSPEYGITISKGLIGDISLNGLLTTDKRIGIGVSLGF